MYFIVYICLRRSVGGICMAVMICPCNLISKGPRLVYAMCSIAQLVNYNRRSQRLVLADSLPPLTSTVSKG